jgi:hypothetical protein
MPQNGQINEKFGVYRSICCGAEIVLQAGAIFPDCPNHQKLTTGWKPVPEAKLPPMEMPSTGSMDLHSEMQKADYTSLANHIENRRLFDLACGRVKFQNSEEQHVHECELCQGVLYILLNQPMTGLMEDAPKPADAA